MSGARDGIDSSYRLWDVVERSEGGHERRRRLFWRMTEQQAGEWEAANGAQLIRVEESAAGSDSTAPLRGARLA